jgi:hypothetical protein
VAPNWKWTARYSLEWYELGSSRLNQGPSKPFLAS